jgi:hypothetical protein
VPAGIPGERYIAGGQVGRGYFGRPGTTAAAFLPDPYADGPGARRYRTGDRARWRADGVLEYLGRCDEQVKVRGYRIEPAEVEHVLREHPGVREAVVGVREDTPGDRRLVAHLVPARTAPTAAELRAYLGDRLPRHLIPAAFVTCGSLPRLPSGKLDRRALPAPPVSGPEPGGRPPGTPAETAVARVFGEVFGVAGVGADDDFFALGGHSLLATKVVARLRTVLGVDLPVNAIFLAPTVAGLAERIDELSGAGTGGEGRGAAAAEPAGIAVIDRSRYRVRRSALPAVAPADGALR